MPPRRKSSGGEVVSVPRPRQTIRPSSPRGGASDESPPEDELITPGTTGRYLVLLRTDAIQEGIKTLTDDVGLKVVNSADFKTGTTADILNTADAVLFDELAVAVVNTPPDQLRMLSTASADDNAILAIEPERVVYALDEGTPTPAFMEPPPGPVTSTSMGMIPVPTTTNGGSLPLDYLLGYREAVNHLVDQVLKSGGGAAALTPEAQSFAETEAAWGLQITGAAASRYSGRGVKVAVLDTGFDLGHPDFTGRRIVSQSFIMGEAVQDQHGHGTHCVGTACGPLRPATSPRYGVAYEAEIYVGKVLSNRGSGSDSGILAGINWAISNGCAVISMSLGAPISQGQTFSRIYETVARRALNAGTLIIAAAGNESQRPGRIAPVGHPANCPSILAVAAVDSGRRVAVFSCGGVNLQGGQVDISAPGVDVYSSWPRPMLNRRLNGTSMATPHVAGIAALHAQANSDVRGGALGWLLLQSALRLDMSTQDIGAGLVQAP